MFFWEFCEIFKNIYSAEHLRMAASEKTNKLNIFILFNVSQSGNWEKYMKSV